MKVDMPSPRLEGKASSGYDVATIDRRLAAIAGREDEAAREERAFLERLRAGLTEV